MPEYVKVTGMGTTVESLFCTVKRLSTTPVASVTLSLSITR